ncbi:MAG: hypothetical protein M3Q39_01745 [Actinomycetota bacterium]|nr:hypothetical protein [Actinomycetota bacterium]
MATVPHSQKTTSAIKDKAAEYFTNCANQAAKAIAEDFDFYRLIAVAATSEEQVALALKLTEINSGWTVKNMGSLNVLYSDAIRAVSFHIDLTDKPYPVAIYTSVTHKLNELKDDPRWTGVITRMAELYVPYKRAIDDKIAIEQAIDAVVEATPNIQRAAEVMPNILNWLPDDVRKRYDAPQPKKAAKRASAEEIATSALTPEALAAMARARMSAP